MILDRYSDNKLKKIVETKLSSLIKAPLSLTITDNTRSIISVKRDNHTYLVRLHHMFLDADARVLRSLAKYISGNLQLTNKVLRDYIRENEGKIRRPLRPRKPGSIRITSQGRHFNLKDFFQRLNQRYFGGKANCTITWGNRRKRHGQESIRLGSYSLKTNIIRINPILDRPSVPGYVVDDVVYHEMLHHLLGVEKRNGRRIYHHETFRKMEKKFIHREKARLWVREKLSRLL